MRGQRRNIDVVSRATATDSRLPDLAVLRARARAHLRGQADPAAAPVAQAVIAYQVLESLIASMEIPPGMVLKLETLQDLLGLGRSPVREALKLLEADGVVQLRQRTGVTITAIQPKDQLRILAVRRPLELLASQLGCQGGADAEREGLALLADQLLEAGAGLDARRMMRLGTACYHRLLALADNSYLQRPLLSVYSLSRRYYYLRLSSGEMMIDTTRLHHERFRSVIACDVPRAEAATNALIDYFEQIARADAGA